MNRVLARVCRSTLGERSLTIAAIGVAAGLVMTVALGATAQQPLENALQLSQQSTCSGSSTIETNRCLRLQYEAADRRLNQVYQTVRATLKPTQKETLTDAQLAWIQFRDKSCEFEVYESRGGTGYQGFLHGCLERVTRARTAELEAWRRGQ
jgi:uncharacterized protein YecT (DUF1311 family)